MDPTAQSTLDQNAIDAADLIYPGGAPQEPGLSGPPPSKPYPGVSGDAGGYFSGGSSIGRYFLAIPSWAWLVLGAWSWFGVLVFSDQWRHAGADRRGPRE